MRMDAVATMSWHVRDVLANLRAADRIEIAAAHGGFQLESLIELWIGHVARAVAAWTFLKDGAPVALFTALASSARGLHVNLIATDGFDMRFGVRVAREIRERTVPDLIAQGFTRLECRVHEHHHKARRFLEFCGGVEEVRVRGLSADDGDFIQVALVAEPAAFDETEKRDVPDQAA